MIGVDEHVWRHTHLGDRYMTVVIDLTPVRDRTGPARLLAMVPGRSKQAFKGWLAQQDPRFRASVEVVAMDGFTGFKTAASEEFPAAVAVMDPFHVVKLVADALDETRRRVQQWIFGRRGRRKDPLFITRKVLLTSTEFLTDKNHRQLENLFAEEDHLPVEMTWSVYQQVIAAYHNRDRTAGCRDLAAVIDSIAKRVPTGHAELARLGRTLAKRRADILALLRPPRHQQRANRGAQRQDRAPPRDRSRAPKHQQLQPQSTTRHRRPQTPVPLSNRMSRQGSSH